MIQRTISVVFATGAFGDCARHAILAALENPEVAKIKVFAREPVLQTLYDKSYKCGCPEDHGEMLRSSSTAESKIEKHCVDVASSDPKELEKLEMGLASSDAVISGLGNRQPFLGDRVGQHGTTNLVRIMEKLKINRFVVMSSIGINDDKPCMEWRWEGKIMTFLFNTLCRREYWDLTGAENAASSSDLNYLIVRPVGLGEEVVPSGEYFIQKKKFDDVVGFNMAKADVGKFLVDQALTPTYERKAVVIGANPKNEEQCEEK